jgi:hypothetical protein
MVTRCGWYCIGGNLKLTEIRHVEHSWVLEWCSNVDLKVGSWHQTATSSIGIPRVGIPNVHSLGTSNSKKQSQSEQDLLHSWILFYWQNELKKMNWTYVIRVITVISQNSKVKRRSHSPIFVFFFHTENSSPEIGNQDLVQHCSWWSSSATILKQNLQYNPAS